MTHPCPITACRHADIPNHKLMCKDHWLALPHRLAREVNEAWSVYRVARRAQCNTAKREAAARYALARQAAIDYVHARGIP